MNNFNSHWLLVNNTPKALEIEKAQKPKYPLALCLPITTISKLNANTQIPIDAKKIYISSSLSFKVLDNKIKNIYPSIIITTSFLENRIKNPTIRDIGNTYYMNKWLNNSVKLGPPLDINKKELASKEIIVKINNRIKKANIKDYFFNVNDFIYFTTKHITLENTLITLGINNSSTIIKNHNKKLNIKILIP